MNSKTNRLVNGHQRRVRLRPCTHAQFIVQITVAFALPVFPNAGGFNLEHVTSLRQSGNTSTRRVILLKGYQHWAGRALVGVRALAMCADVLHGYTVAIYAATPDVEISAKLFSQDTGIPVEFIWVCFI